MNLPNRDNSRPNWQIQRREGVLWRITLTLGDTGEIVNHYLVAADDCLTLQDVLNIYHDDESFLAHAIGRPYYVNRDMLLLGIVELGLITTMTQHD